MARDVLGVVTDVAETQAGSRGVSHDEGNAEDEYESDLLNAEEHFELGGLSLVKLLYLWLWMAPAHSVLTPRHEQELPTNGRSAPVVWALRELLVLDSFLAPAAATEARNLRNDIEARCLAIFASTLVMPSSTRDSTAGTRRGKQGNSGFRLSAARYDGSAFLSAGQAPVYVGCYCTTLDLVKRKVRTWRREEMITHVWRFALETSYETRLHTLRSSARMSRADSEILTLKPWSPAPDPEFRHEL
ncbi:hypothetical protein EXIGLDRAFT_694378 [Exidia glandulosa HHB12029]|uniref:Uncharacterized protein n=1 Tax=Exidia glandulosa HHB12029 TaxID=1314781 RepID=A0A165NP11_EXIGL|nr:hypothetical protein EXIGLDRAFT_694378 [Exidia glandulosa HHB12029]